MPTDRLVRISGAANILGGLSIAAFVIEHPWGRFYGAEVAMTTAWTIAHALHLLGATLAVVGLVGLYALHARHVGAIGAAGFTLALAGTSLFVGTGILTALIWPTVAVHAPELLAVDGALFAPPPLLAFLMTALVLSVGYLLFGAVMLRASLLPRWAIALWMVGGVIGMIPPRPLGPLPWAALVAGGVIYGLGAVGLGVALWRGPEAGGA